MATEKDRWVASLYLHYLPDELQRRKLLEQLKMLQRLSGLLFVAEAPMMPE